MTVIGVTAFNYGLAIGLKRSIIEAFYLTSGSMAPTLLGEHVTESCSQCGHSIQVAASRYPGLSPWMNCNHCGSRTEITGVGVVDEGDGLLADKLSSARRWDLVVYRAPHDSTTTFAGRVVGVPGEIIQILDGDIYTASLDPLRSAGYPLESWEQVRRDIHAYAQAGSPKAEIIFQRIRELNDLLLPHLIIQRKPLMDDDDLGDLWLPVYQQGLPAAPTGRPALGDFQAFAPEDENTASAWTLTESAATCNVESAEPQFIHYTRSIDDRLVYNGWARNPPAVPVGDLRLRLCCQIESGSGRLVLCMNRDTDLFTVEICIDGTVRLLHSSINGSDAAVALAERSGAMLTPGRTHEVEFAIRDYQVGVALQGDTVLTTTADQYRPDTARLVAQSRGLLPEPVPSQIRIGASELVCTLTHVTIDRDVYYRIEHQLEPGNSMERNPFIGWPGWGTADMPLLLYPERQVDGRWIPAEYFILGDNSAISKDSRLGWERSAELSAWGVHYQRGTILEDHLIGVVRWIYHPWSRMRAIH